jgi:hypothetical protein
MTWLSSVLPPFALSAFGSEWMAARVSQHRVRTRFPGATSRHVPHVRDAATDRRSAQVPATSSTQASGRRASR